MNVVVDTSVNVKDSFVENYQILKIFYGKIGNKKTPAQQRQYLNYWVLSKTNNKIKNLFPEGFY